MLVFFCWVYNHPYPASTTQRMSVSESQHPIRIPKIESGSMWVKLFGELWVIDLLVFL